MRPPGPPPGAPPGMPPPRPPMAQGGFPPSGMQPGMPFGFPPAMPNFPPPLPPGWTEHTAPDGRTKYFYNAGTKESTYTRPTFPGPFPAFPGPGPAGPSTIQQPSPVNGVDQSEKKKKKKEKPKGRVAVPGTTWQRVTTTEGNIFYFEKESKRSEWTVPDEIKDQIAELDRQEAEEKEAEAQAQRQKEEDERIERLKEQERVRVEVEEERKRKREAVDAKKQAAHAAKRQKTEDENGEDDPEDVDQAEEDGEGAEVFGPEDEEDEEAWMKAVAAEFAQADAKVKAEQEEDQEQVKLTEEEAARQVFAVPEKVHVSLEEGKALFRALLMEKDISPFAPWDQSLPLFINDPRYILLSSAKDRREVYEDYCRDVGRARRLNKPSTTTNAPAKVDPERDYKALMREEVSSTRTRWVDFRKKWRKDRRFYSFGRDDRDREKLFKTHLRELGERKRADAQRAEEDFLDLLKETDGIDAESQWSNVKKGIARDPRYDAVGSSSLREEFFASYVKKLSTNETAPEETPEEAAERKLKERKEKAEASLREREAKVRQDKGKVDKEVGRSRAGAGKEEAERLFGSLLVDQVRDHELSWSEAQRFLQNDPRFSHSSLSPFDKQRLFAAHITRISSRRSNALHNLFETHAPSLDTKYDVVYPHIIDDPLVKRLGLSAEALEDRYESWQQGREESARQEFTAMLGENSFVDFWSRMRKKTVDEAAANVQEDEMEEGEGMGEGGAADLTAMGKQIDLEEIKSVLRRDKRYRQFDHMPEVRERWLKEYLENVEAASGSKTIHNVGGQR